MSASLRKDRALVFRILHRANVAWVMDHGLHCAASAVKDPNFVAIGSAELIDKRRYRATPCPPYGNLSDYVPFYFTPFTPMLYNIKTGRNVPKHPSEEIVILVTSLPHLRAQNVPFLFTDRHAYLQAAQFTDDLTMLDRIDWDLLASRDFRRDPEDLEKLERYQAEALVYKHVPITGILGMMCYDDATRATLESAAVASGCTLSIVTRPGLYL